MMQKVAPETTTINNNYSSSNQESVSSNYHQNAAENSSSSASSMKQMGLGSELFGLPRDGDQPAVLSAPPVHQGHDTSAVATTTSGVDVHQENSTAAKASSV